MTHDPAGDGWHPGDRAADWLTGLVFVVHAVARPAPSPWPTPAQRARMRLRRDHTHAPAVAGVHPTDDPAAR